MDERPTPTVLGALRLYRLTSLIIVVVAFALSVGFGYLTRKDTTATARMILATPTSDDPVGVNAATEPTFVRYVAQRALFVTSHQVLTVAAKDLGNTSFSSLRDKVSATSSGNGSAVSVTVSGNSSAGAARIANAVVRAYMGESKKQVQAQSSAALSAIGSAQEKIIAALGADLAARNPTYQALGAQAGTITVASAQFGSGVTFVDPATAAQAAKPGPPYIDALVGLVLGLLIAATVAWVRADNALERAAAADAGEAPARPDDVASADGHADRAGGRTRADRRRAERQGAVRGSESDAGDAPE